MVSILCPTYNHARFISRALDGFVMQRVPFPFEVLVFDDASTDGTTEVVRAYSKKYPELIKAFVQAENQYQQGASKWGAYVAWTFKQAQGRYHAFCDGDDYWTDPSKLQKQVDFLESHPQCSMCSHNVKVIYEDEPTKSHPFIQGPMAPMLTVEDVLWGCLVLTSSMLSRSGLIGELPSWFSKMPMGDWPFQILNALHGPIGYLDECMSVYRVNKGSLWSSQPLATQLKRMVVGAEILRKKLPIQYEKTMYKVLAAYNYLVAKALFAENDARGALYYTLRSIMADRDQFAFRKKFWARVLLRALSPGLYDIASKLVARLKHG